MGVNSFVKFGYAKFPSCGRFKCRKSSIGTNNRPRWLEINIDFELDNEALLTPVKRFGNNLPVFRDTL